MKPERIESVRGMHDVLSESCESYRAIEAKLQQCFESFGYRPIDVPIVEPTELYLRKSGEDIVTRMYDFVYQNRRLCLRPEMTASVIRAYIENFEQLPLPVRLYYSGSVFRYERPQRSRYRQFTQIGVELIGSAGAMADAEAIWTACKSLDQLGVEQYRVIISHIGVLSQFLSSLDLGSRMQDFLLASMEMLRQPYGRQTLQQRLQDIYPPYRPPTALVREDIPVTNGSDDAAQGMEHLLGIFQGMQETEARTAILAMLSSLNINLSGNRSSEEIADRLLAKIKGQDQIPRIDRALEFMSELTDLQGDPFDVLAQGEALLTKYNIDCAPLQELRAMVDILKLYNLDWEKVSLDLGLSRGIQYYTGTVFEIHTNAADKSQQLCGGGRYDDLIVGLGGKRPTPATGFSFGLERVHQALASEGKLADGDRTPADAFVIPLNREDYGYAIHVAEALRGQGVRVELTVRARSTSNRFQYAAKQKFPFVVVVGPEERRNDLVTLNCRNSKAGQRMAIDAAATHILQARPEGQA